MQHSPISHDGMPEFTSRISISMRMPQFFYTDRSGEEHWIAEEYSCNHTGIMLNEPLEISVQYAPNEKPLL
jgi:hypothetical protein